MKTRLVRFATEGEDAPETTVDIYQTFSMANVRTALGIPNTAGRWSVVVEGDECISIPDSNIQTWIREHRATISRFVLR